MMNTFPLHHLPKGKYARIHAIRPSPHFGDLDHMVSRRLNDLGFLSGTTIEVIATGLFGKGPYAVRINGQAQFSLRRSEAEKIVCIHLDISTETRP